MTKTKKKSTSIEQEANATLRALEEKDPGLKRMLKKAYGYAVFPSVGKASLVVGGSYGKGAVFQHGKFIGYATIGQTTVGVQIGGDTFAEVILFENREAFERMKHGKMSFAADASAVLVKAGAAAAKGFGPGTRAFVYGKGGMLLEAAIGGQKFSFKPAGQVKGEEEKEQAEAKQKDSEQEDADDEEGEEGTDLMTRAAGAARNAVSGAGDFVKEHPLAATAIGVGVLGGAALLVMRAWRSSGDSSQEEESNSGGSDEEESDDSGAQMSDEGDDQGNREDEDSGEERGSRGNGRRGSRMSMSR
jgi:ElaB/YqjD/DUF883 family membrane-anchored ribosome-binding protein